MADSVVSTGKPPDGGHTLTRRDVAHRLGVSTSSVRRLENVQLHPAQDASGVYRFDPQEVAALQPLAQQPRNAVRAERRATTIRGRMAARVFGMFARQSSLPEIVMATKQPPDVVRQLYREWSTTLEEGDWERRNGTERV